MSKRETVVKIRGFGFYKIIENLTEFWCQNGLKNDPKNDILEIRGVIFEILGGFWRSPFFDEFSVCQKSAKNRKKSANWRPGGGPYFLDGPAERALPVGGLGG